MQKARDELSAQVMREEGGGVTNACETISYSSFDERDTAFNFSLTYSGEKKKIFEKRKK